MRTDCQISKLAGTLQHYRNWAGQIQARYQLFNPDAARPARRIYVGGLSTDTSDVSSPHNVQGYPPLHPHSQHSACARYILMAGPAFADADFASGVSLTAAFMKPPLH